MTKDIFQLSSRKARIAISPTCNLNCIYCDGSKGRKPDKPGAMEDFRQKPLEEGVIKTSVYLKILEELHKAGFTRLTLTGGEPLLNLDWDIVVKKAKRIGFSHINLTTNGMLLENYLKEKNQLPKELTLLTISLDTIDDKELKSITGGAKLNIIMKGLKAVKKSNPDLPIRANKVAMRRNLKTLPLFIKLCEDSGIIDEINLINLILKEPKDRKNRTFFSKEFVTAKEIINFISKKIGYKFVMDNLYEFRTKTANGLEIILKDTNQTFRDKQCDKCPIYCQEGFFTIRVATDGAIRVCLDYKNELPLIDGPKKIKEKALSQELNKVIRTFRNTHLEKTNNKFIQKYNIKLKK